MWNLPVSIVGLFVRARCVCSIWVNNAADKLG
jgi:hypothetical protein